MEFRLLGPLDVRDDAADVPVGGGRQRALLALLLLSANEVVSRDRLIDELWSGRPPETALTVLHGHVSQLRKALQAGGNGANGGRLLTRPPGYMLRVHPDELDLHRFERLVTEGRDSLARGDAGRAAEILREALALWRGRPLADVPDSAFAQAEVARLEDLRAAALEERIDADLALGRHVELVGELEGLARRYPLRERLRGQLMLALYRSGRQAEALEVYQRARRDLLSELGLEPSPALQELEPAILRRDPDLEAPQATPLQRTGTRRRWALVVAAVAIPLAAAATIGLAVTDRDPEKKLLTGHGPYLSVVDPRTNQLVATEPVALSPWAVAAGEGGVWVASSLPHTVSRIDPRSYRVTRNLRLLAGPTSVAVGGGDVWLTVTHELEGVVRVDTALEDTEIEAALLARGRFSGNDHWGGINQHSIAYGHGSAWATATLDRKLDTVRLRSRWPPVWLDGRPPGCTTAGIGTGRRFVWIACQEGLVVRIDPTTNKRVGVTAINGTLRAIAAGAGAVWVTDIGEDVVWRLDPQTGRRQRSISVGREPSGVAVGEGGVWVANESSGTVSRIDPATNEVVATIPVGARPRGIAAGEGRVWVTILEGF